MKTIGLSVGRIAQEMVTEQLLKKLKSTTAGFFSNYKTAKTEN
ncbi:hypothetical protein [Fictibacillus sp. NRS-1165]